MERAYKSGDIVFYLLDHLCIRCTILEVNDRARKLHPDGTLFYRLDEPIGHDTAGDEFFDSLDVALVALLEEVADYKELLQELRSKPEPGDTAGDFLYIPPTLESVRAGRGAFIQSTHPSGCNCGCADLASKYPVKERGLDWWAVKEDGSIG